MTNDLSLVEVKRTLKAVIDKQGVRMPVVDQMPVFNWILLQGINALGSDAYAERLGPFLEDVLNRKVNLGQVSMALKYLRKRGLLQGRKGALRPKLGRPPIIHTLTPKGRATMTAVEVYMAIMQKGST